MKNYLCKCLSLAIAFGSAISVQAAHWELVSFSDSTYTASDGTVIRGGRSSTSATLPAGSLYGVGPFPFYGESAQFGKKVFCGNPGMQFYTAWSQAYYTFVYKWVPTSITDVPPPVGSSNNPVGYSLERVHDIHQSNFNPIDVWNTISAGIWGWSANFNTQGPIWGGTGISPYLGQSFQWPLSTEPDKVSIGGQWYYVRPIIVGGGVVSLDGSGNTIFTMTVLNDQLLYLSTPVSSSDPLVTSIAFHNGGNTACFKGAAKIFDLPVVD